MRGDDKRARILDTARRLFVEQGYAHVSMDALAHAVPVSKPTLYNHFRDKKALFTAVMQNRCIFISENIERVLLKEDGDVEATLTMMGERFLSVVLDPQAIAIYRTVITEASNFPELGKLFYDSGPLRCKAIFTEYLERLHQRKILHIPNARRAAEMFFGMMVGRMQMPLLLGIEKKASPKIIAEHIRYVAGVFLRGQQPGKL